MIRQCVWMTVVTFAITVYWSDQTNGVVRRWDNGAVIAGTDHVELAPFQVVLSHFSTAERNLRYADFSGGLDIQRAQFEESWLDHASFRDSNLTDAFFRNSSLAQANFAGTLIEGTEFVSTTDSGFTKEQLYSTRSYQQQNLQRTNFALNDLQGWNFQGQDLTQANFTSSNVVDADFRDAIIVGAKFGETSTEGLSKEQLYSTKSYQQGDLHSINLIRRSLIGWNFRGQNLTSARLLNTELTNADFTDAIIDWINLGQVTYRGFTEQQLQSTQNYQRSNLQGVRLQYNDLSGWNFSGLDLSNATFANSYLRTTDFSNAILINTDLTAVTQRGFTAAQLYSTRSYLEKDLRGLNLSSNDISGWDFAQQNLEHSNLSLSLSNLSDYSNSNVSRSDLRNADLYYTNFANASLVGSTFDGADLRRANLVGANLHTASLQGVNLEFADLTNANLSYSVLSNAELNGARFDGAIIHGITFSASTLAHSISTEQLYSTQSYREGTMYRVNLLNMDMRQWNFAGQQLWEGSFANSDLTGADLGGADLRGMYVDQTNFTNANLEGAILTSAYAASANFRNAVLTNAVLTSADLSEAILADADMRNAILIGANLDGTTSNGFTFKQLESTASFIHGELREIHLAHTNLSGWDFSGINLMAADFSDATVDDGKFTQSCLAFANFSGASLHAADFSRADLRSATGDFSTAIRTNTIEPDGHVHGMHLRRGDMMSIRDLYLTKMNDYSVLYAAIPVVIEDAMLLEEQSTLELVLSANEWEWESTISFAAEIPIQLAGELRLRFETSENIASQIGRQYKLFDWTGTTPSGVFHVESDYEWDLSRLYSTGEVTLIAIPEPSCGMAYMSLLTLVYRCRRRPSRRRPRTRTRPRQGNRGQRNCCG